MENLRNTIDLTQICYPVFSLPISKTPQKEGTLLYTYSESVNESTQVVTPKILIVDDTSIEAETLAKRRLKLLTMGVPLAKLGRATFFLGDLVKLATPQRYFIDSYGKLFVYEKRTRAKLEYRRILNVFPLRNSGVLIEVEGLPARLKSLFPPSTGDKYAGILEFNKSYILYGFSNEPGKTSWRKI